MLRLIYTVKAVEQILECRLNNRLSKIIISKLHHKVYIFKTLNRGTWNQVATSKIEVSFITTTKLVRQNKFWFLALQYDNTVAILFIFFVNSVKKEFRGKVLQSY